MMLKDFLRRATKRERTEVADACHSSVPYLYQIAGGHRFASPIKAAQIERSTQLLAQRTDGRLPVVPRATLVRYPQIFEGVYLLPDPRAVGDDYEPR